MESDTGTGTFSRREAMKTALKAGAYAAPMVLTASVPSVVLAAVSPAPTATSVPTPTATLSVSLTGTTPDVPLDIRGVGFASGRTINIAFTSPSGTVLNSLQTITSTSGTLRALFDSNNLPSGMLTVTATDDNATTFPAPVLAQTTFTNVFYGPENMYVNFSSFSILAGAPATVNGFQFTPGASYTITIITADGTTAATIPVMASTALPNQGGGGQVTATFSTAGFPLGTITAAIGPSGSSSLLTFTTGRIV